MMTVTELPARMVVAGLADRQCLRSVLEAVSAATHGALLGPRGQDAHDRRIAWGFPERSLLWEPTAPRLEVVTRSPMKGDVYRMVLVPS